MSKDLNQCNFIGRLGRDVEQTFTQAGSPIAKFSIACSDDYKNKEGQKVERTNWVNVVAFGKLAEICGQYLSKGSQVYVSGKQVTTKWQDKEGNNRYTTEINASELQMLGGRSESNDNGQRQGTPAQQARPQANQSNEIQPDYGDFDSQIPF